MKLIIPYILLFLFSLQLAWGQTYTKDATLVNQKSEAVAIIRSSGIHEKKKEAIQMAIKSAFDAYFFSGIEGLNDGKPLLTEKAATESAAYLERFFNGGYSTFVASYVEEKEEKLPNKNFKATVKLEMYTRSLVSALEKNNVELNREKPEITVSEIEQEVYQPTMMVVPFKQQGISYKEILNNSVDYRTAINEVQNALIKEGYSIKDFFAVLEATEKSTLMESNTSIESFDKMLIDNSGTDVYIVVDAGYNSTAEGHVGYMGVKAYERASGNMLSSKQATTRRYQKAILADLYRIAFTQINKDLLKEITAHYAGRIEKGNTYVLRVSVGQGASIDLDSRVGPRSIPLSDVLRLWVRKNALNGRFHVQGSVRDLIAFDQIQSPPKSDDGYFADANDFAFKLFEYLIDELNINCDKRVDGNTIYITITE